MTRTPEGFLICHNVPIARTGWYQYLGEEIGADDKRGQIVKVYRNPDEVFGPTAIASFEGKTVTDEHPPELLDSDNNNIYDKGDVTNVRQGKGEQSDLLLADLVVKDGQLINEIEQGKREVSCGYDCVYSENEDGTYSQGQICGNHVAIVENGRAGNRVAIKDSNKKLEGEKNNMAGKTKLPRKHSIMTDFFTAIGLKHFAMDAEPEEIMDAMEGLTAEKQEKDEETKAETKATDEEPTAQSGDGLKELASKVDKLTDIVSKLVESDKRFMKKLSQKNPLMQ